MSVQNKISESIPRNVLNDCMTWINNISSALSPYLQSLTPEERRDILKLGPKSVGYLDRLTDHLSTAPQFIPGYMDVAEFHKDMAVVSDLQPLAQVISQLDAAIDDTRMLAGSEAFAAAQLYYAAVKSAAAANVPLAQDVYADLSTRFPSPGKRSQKAS